MSMNDEERALQKAAALEQPPMPAYGNISANVNPLMQYGQPQPYMVPSQPYMQPQGYPQNYAPYPQQPQGYPQNYAPYPQQFNSQPYMQPQPQPQTQQQPNVASIPVIDPKNRPAMSEEAAAKRFDETCTCRCCHGGIEDGKFADFFKFAVLFQIY